MAHILILDERVSVHGLVNSLHAARHTVEVCNSVNITYIKKKLRKSQWDIVIVEPTNFLPFALDKLNTLLAESCADVIAYTVGPSRSSAADVIIIKPTYASTVIKVINGLLSD